ncbi:capsuleen [Tritrichomonas foetus]|uniref:Capsuleen n=1 Tax=Tritrichomonas foetus TaxID=1144522 RepID=A0A1J4K577_9EUKA|nr:capsuleen [Tritrichomonas foetus]|eukprot:OHT04653.1 capsuleen [Tritrichomonas foetus]
MIDTLLNIIHASPVSQFLTEFNLPMDTIGVNLPSYAYEIFEADRMKYKLFFLAISKSILAINKPKDKIILAVLGAGRGPLVDCAIKAGIKHIYGIEKNHIAMNFLKQKKEKEWKEYDIILFEKDIREIENITDIKGHDLEKADIIVSELLGSLGDNELAPEILRQYEHIGKTNCAMIPNNFSSILVPIMSEFLWSKAFNESKLNKILIIHLNASIFLSEPKQCFEFVYPGENILYKTITMDFLVKTNATCHGFGGWFVSTLFDDITMTTSPIDGTNDLFSWAPVFLPIDQPFLVQTGDRITLTIKRKGNNKIVWYEWAVFNPVITAIQNAGGSSYSMKLY